MRSWIAALGALVALVPATLPAPARAEGPQPLALALYAPWFDDNTWNAPIVPDLPVPLFNSDDDATFRRDITLAQKAGIDAFVSFWVGPGNRTDHNFAKLLRLSEGTGFRSAVDFLSNVSGAPDMNALIEGLRYVRRTYGNHPNYLRHNGRPVVFFTDMGRIPGAEGMNPVDAWRSIRDQVDPDRGMVWIAEGLDASFLAVFDGIYVLKITHRAFPEDYVKAPRWAQNARARGADKLWVATIMPGWDDTRIQDTPGGARAPSPPHIKEREGGDFYRRTFQAAMASRPDWIMVVSWNEYLEGTVIHPSRGFGDQYIGLTAELLSQFKTNGNGAASSPASSPSPSTVASPLGFTVSNEAGIPFADTYRQWSLQTVGYAASRRFSFKGLVTQAMQKLVFQWQPGNGLFYLNVFDEMHNAGHDVWLEAFRSIPPPGDTRADAGLTWDQVVQRHVALLDQDPALKRRYLAEPGWMDVFGLPMGYADYGDVAVVRGQRAALQRWKVAVPWARAGEITVINGGDLAKEAGLFPKEALSP